MSHLLDESATERQTVDAVYILAILNDAAIPINQQSPVIGGIAEVKAVIVNNILTEIDLFGRKRSDFSSLKDCVYSHLVEMKRGDIELNHYFKD